jgi:hypothetical protein
MAIVFDDAEYEEVPTISLFASKELVNAWERLGRPDSPLTPSGERLMNVIVTVWEELYPQEVKKWTEDRKDYKLSELSITEQVHKHTGRSLASYPYFVFHAMKRLFPKFDAVKRENCLKMVRKYPMFKLANKA